MRNLSFTDKAIGYIDRAVKTLHPGATKAYRPSPSKKIPLAPEPDQPSASNTKHIAGLMRINHTGEVCAQALYSGQSLTAKSQQVKQDMLESAREEEDHLAWCEEHLKELNSRTSYLNPLFYASSFIMGAAAGLVSDEFSLGFIAATEDRVCQHLRDHLEQLPANEQRTRAILEQMISDEEHHGQKALDAGGVVFSQAQKQAMVLMSKVMTHTTYRI